MDALDLSQEDRERLKWAVINRRDAVGSVIGRMEGRGWYTDDGALQCLRAAFHALHAAVQALAAADGKPVRPPFEMPFSAVARIPPARGAGAGGGG